MNHQQVTPQSLPLYECALAVELFLALLIIWGVRQPLGGPTTSLSISAAATVKMGSGEIPVRPGIKQPAGLDVVDEASDSLRAPLLGTGEKTRTLQNNDGVARNACKIR